MYVWAKGFTPKFQVPIVNEQTFPIVYKYMNDCRGIRGTDDKGLSGWSCGFGNTGNPTKIQARHQRKLSVILGAMQMDMTGPVIIIDNMEGETHMLAAQLRLWSLKHNLRRFFFKTSDTATRINALLGVNRYSGQNTVDSTTILFPEPSATAAKASEWEKMDAQAGIFLREKYPIVRHEGQIVENDHLIIGTLLLSEEYFQAQNCKVFTFGSVHNMYGYLSNRPFYCAISSGTSEFHLDKIQLEPISAGKFKSTCCVHNGYRTGYFLEPKYFFNPKMNFLRHIKGKTINFDTVEMEDAPGYDYSSDEEEGWDEEDTSSSEDDQGEGTTVFKMGGKIDKGEDDSSDSEEKVDDPSPLPGITPISAAVTALRAQVAESAGKPLPITVTKPPPLPEKKIVKEEKKGKEPVKETNTVKGKKKPKKHGSKEKTKGSSESEGEVISLDLGGGAMKTVGDDDDVSDF